jgi:hypothetical protein
LNQSPNNVVVHKLCSAYTKLIIYPKKPRTIICDNSKLDLLISIYSLYISCIILQRIKSLVRPNTPKSDKEV